MGTSYREYAGDRRANLSSEGQRALEVFNNAHALGSVLAEARKLQGLSQRELESRSGVDQADISRIERGELAPTSSTLLRLTMAMRARVLVEVFENDLDFSRVPAAAVVRSGASAGEFHGNIEAAYGGAAL